MLHHMNRAAAKLAGKLPADLIATTTAIRDSNTSGTVTLNVPSHQQGDLLFVCPTVNASGFITSIPSGWTEIAKTTGQAERLGVYYKVASASEPASYSWGVAAAAALLSFSIRNATEYTLSGFALGSTNSATASSITTYGGGLVIAIAGIDNIGALNSATNSNYTFGGIVNSGFGASGFSGAVGIAVTTTNTVGNASGTTQLTISTNQGLAAAQLAVG